MDRDRPAGGARAAPPAPAQPLRGTATGLLVVTPGDLDEYFAELHAALTGNGGPAGIAAVQHRYGIVRS